MNLQKPKKLGPRTLAGDPTKTRELGPYQDTTKTRKPGPRTLAGPYKKTEIWDLGPYKNWDPNETLRKPKKWDEVPYWDPKTGTAGPNVILEKLYNCKSVYLFICLLLQLNSAFMGSCPTIRHMFFALSTKLMSCP